ncbi:tRNA (adenosine(37)-N6)-threonylcarbamoyltransferase complex dimerization subunit type 1 TsaB [Acholeplasma granularum]|uniref:tRNA (adenosine(37)-N6)-threonylcarbamoyltransferase complex dimerization subunit type 1 TsaB n=1 Tax=Acholeplasma granularum TaxID=264635 RepID=UPI0004BC6DD7|nr:tRNA (adenosine(37)-N6)-threonylcarbamoyltransferase complex dimerization subunit type 1 TsaB [Acholeplasma granularum]
MKYLLIDSSTNTLIIMLHDNNHLIEEQIRVGKSDHQAHIIPMIEQLLLNNNLKVKDLDGIIVGVGPGSYTGLRVGVMTAKMLAYSANINLYKISSLIFLTSGYEKNILAWHDARNNQGFSAHIKLGKITSEEKVRHMTELSNSDLDELLILDANTIKVDGKVILQEKVVVDNIYELIPNYLRKTEAEKNLDKNSNHS